MPYLFARWRWLTLLGLASLLSGCLALPQTGLFAFRLAVTSLGIEDVRIGNYPLNAGLDTHNLSSLIASSLGAGSLPVQATLALGLGLPAGMPAVQMDGFKWTLEVPGVDPVKGEYQQTVALTPGDGANLRLPVAFDLIGSHAQTLSPMINLAQQLVNQGKLPSGSELAINPGDLRGLGMTLPAGLMTPTLRLAVGDDGQLTPIR